MKLKFGEEDIAECEKGCQYSSIMHEIEDGTLNQIYDEIDGEIEGECESCGECRACGGKDEDI